LISDDKVAIWGILYYISWSKIMKTDKFIPANYQKELPLSEIIIHEKPGEEKVDFDIVFVGAGPASLAGAIKLAQLVKAENEKSGGKLGEVQIAVVEKANEVGQHILSGAIINPRTFRELFPNLKAEEFPFCGPVKGEKVLFLTKNKAIRLPTPPPMKNHGNFVASLCEVTRWLAQKAEELGVNIITGFPVKGLLVENNQVIGVRTADSGKNRDGKPLENYQPGTDIAAKVVVLGEGSRGLLTQAFLKWQNIKSPNPQIYAQGVKEIWQTKNPLKEVVHTMGWPLPTNVFGGSFMYPMSENLVAVGIVMGLDYEDASLDPHYLLQEMKTHPFFRKYLEGGERLEWGAKTIPEGGYYSLPERFSGNGVMIAGDSAGLVDVPSLKGIHYAMSSGILAAQTIFEALKRNDFSAESLGWYDRAVKDSFIMKDLWRRRNMRLAFKSGFYWGSVKAGLMQISGGRLFGSRIEITADSEVPRSFSPKKSGDATFQPDGKLTFSKLDSVFKSGNATRDNIPSHLIAAENVPPEVAEFYAHVCPAGVYEVLEGKLHINPPNCIDCKATDVLAPRWTPREGGSGPRYKRM